MELSVRDFRNSQKMLDLIRQLFSDFGSPELSKEDVALTAELATLGCWDIVVREELRNLHSTIVDLSLSLIHI